MLAIHVLRGFSDSSIKLSNLLFEHFHAGFEAVENYRRARLKKAATVIITLLHNLFAASD